MRNDEGQMTEDSGVTVTMKDWLKVINKMMLAERINQEI